jgi:hypothetical protein
LFSGPFNVNFSSVETAIDVPQSLYQIIEPGLHSSNSSNNQYMVNVYALPHIQNARSIYIEPLSTSSWELMEIYAQEMEDGIVLSQISVVYPGQVFSLVLGSDRVFVRVLKDGFTAADGHASSKENKDEEGCDLQCLRLVADTEVIVRPKSRKDDADAKSKTKEDIEFPASHPIKILPSEVDFSTEMKRWKKVCDASRERTSRFIIPCPPPFTAWMNPISLSGLPGWDCASASEPDASFSPFSAHVFVRKVHVLDAGAGTNRNKNSSSPSNNHDEIALVELVSSEIVPAGGIGKNDLWLLHFFERINQLKD